MSLRGLWLVPGSATRRVIESLIFGRECKGVKTSSKLFSGARLERSGKYPYTCAYQNRDVICTHIKVVISKDEPHQGKLCCTVYINIFQINKRLNQGLISI